MREIKFRAWDTVNNRMYYDEIESISFAKNDFPTNVSISGFSHPLICIRDEHQFYTYAIYWFQRQE